MEKIIVTISRQFGSMGRSIAHKLSELMSIEYLDRDIVEMTAKRMGLPVSMISNEEEAVKAGFLGRIYPLGVGIPSLKDEICNRTYSR
ncbi:MAG: cytidylate kinase family protein [Lachnospiraceae bacterium]|nr:cytidylate kinase family protein [Lachnospiraceae bacterium]